MAKLDLNINDFQNIQPAAPEILPAGEYVMQIIKSSAATPSPAAAGICSWSLMC